MDENQTNDGAFESIQQEARIARTARMLDESASLKPNQRVDIIERCLKFIEETDYTQAAIARELDISSSTISEILRNRWKGKNGDKHLAHIHNWLELAACRENIVRSKKFVEHSVAREILGVARIAAETCKMAVIYGPARIGKTFTLEAIVDDPEFGSPSLIRVDESTVRPIPLCRVMCAEFKLRTTGTFDALLHRLVKRLDGTKRMLMFDEADRLCYRALETIRDLHDRTDCPILFSGKPKIYERLGIRELGEFSEVTDQLASRIVMSRDLTARTRGDDPQPLYTIEDIRNLIKATGLKLHVTPDAQKRLKDQACTLGMGGIGKALLCIYLAAKLAYAKGDAEITVEHLEDVVELTIGHEDAERIADAVAESSGMRRVV